MRSLFGETVRRMRLDRGLKLKDLANVLEVTPAFLSAVETGKKTVPQSLIEKLRRLWGLSESDVENLKDTAELSGGSINISYIPVAERRFVAGLARTLPELPDLSEEDRKERLEKLMEELLNQIRNKKG